MRFSQILAKFAVSLFTREWIEILVSEKTQELCDVSLFTREWIEIANCWTIRPSKQSPSLRGSGLK